MIKLDERLTAVASEIKPCKTLADIGSDHGKIAVYAALNHLADNVIASDISAKSSLKSQILAKNEGVEISVRVGDGTSTLKPDEYDTVVIAGMGGIEIVDILTKCQIKFNTYILVPHSKPEILRKFFITHNITTIKDYKIKCKGRFYDIILAAVGVYIPSEREIYYGKCIESVAFNEFKQYETDRLMKLLDRTNGVKRNEILSRLNVLNYCNIN